MPDRTFAAGTVVLQGGGGGGGGGGDSVSPWTGATPVAVRGDSLMERREQRAVLPPLLARLLPAVSKLTKL